ncbi:MAG TPA: HNH endonuclease signature motif containing protein, partial [Candidatus Eisenbacteria bacterium]|nr:HNH endonuclease signature motif containing protein [Candidatus Eisenbacteria bacterium]
MVVALAETVEEAPASQADTIPIDSIALPDAEGLDQPRIEEHTERDEAKGAGSPHRIILRQGLPSKELLETILFHLRGGDAHQRAVAFYLVDFDKREEYKLHTCPTTAHFAQARLGLTLREAQELLRVGRKLEILEELDEAFARGAIGWCKLREISRIATPETEWAWLLYAKSHNMREIEHAVRRKKEGDPPPKTGDEGGALQTFLNVLYRLTPKAKLAWETAFEKVSSEFPRGTSNDAIFMYIAEHLLRTPRDPEREGKHAPLYTIVFQVGPDGRGWAEFNEGRMEIPLRDIYEIAGKARVIEVPPLAEGEGKAILQGERGTVPKEERDGPATPAMRFAVSARESHRCAICRRRRPLHGHHFDSRALGGKTLLARLLGACGVCHGLIHAGLIRLRALPGGKLEIRDHEGNLIKEFDLAEMLPPEKLVLIERALAAEDP